LSGEASIALEKEVDGKPAPDACARPDPDGEAAEEDVAKNGDISSGEDVGEVEFDDCPDCEQEEEDTEEAGEAESEKAGTDGDRKLPNDGDVNEEVGVGIDDPENETAARPASW
jgi:hypothetical protein